MKKMNTSPISGMQELSPEKQAIFETIKSNIIEKYRSFGFQTIETPIIDRTEILLAKAGGETEKQIYKVIKTNETADDADQALRFDHTVPLARYVVEHENDISFPFRVMQCGRNFRGERAQKGRFREFYQIDADVIGRGNLPVEYDADVIVTAISAIKTFIKTDAKFTVHINNRKIITGVIQEMGLQSKTEDILSILDHYYKVDPEKTHAAYEEIGLSEAEIKVFDDLLDCMNAVAMAKDPYPEYQHDRLTVLEMNLRTKFPNAFPHGNLGDDAWQTHPLRIGLTELMAVVDLLIRNGIEDFVVDPYIVRGLDYYTGTVFETFVEDYKNIGSICSGGRYDNLASNYTDQVLPGVGISIGLTRLFYVLNEYNLIRDNIASESDRLVDFAIIPFSQTDLGAFRPYNAEDMGEYRYSFEVAERLREIGKSTDIIYAGKNLGDKMSLAAKRARYVVVIGENEVKSGEAEAKDLTTGEKLPLANFLDGRDEKEV